MQQIPDAITPRKNRRVFHLAAIILLLGASVAVIIQKQHEGAAAITAARDVTEKTEVQHHLQVAKFWGTMSLVTVALAMFSWGIAIWRHEKCRWVLVPVIVLLLLFVLLKLLIV